MKNFVAGYYDDRVFKGDFFLGKTSFDKDINCYSLEEVLKLPFVEGVKDYFSETDIDERNFDEISEEEKIKAILDYVEGDEIAGVIYFNTEKEAKRFKRDTIEEIQEIERQIAEGKIIYVGQEQDQYGDYKEVYKYKE